jgi:hypothetical protein
MEMKQLIDYQYLDFETLTYVHLLMPHIPFLTQNVNYWEWCKSAVEDKYEI